MDDYLYLLSSIVRSQLTCSGTHTHTSAHVRIAIEASDVFVCVCVSFVSGKHFFLWFNSIYILYMDMLNKWLNEYVCVCVRENMIESAHIHRRREHIKADEYAKHTVDHHRKLYILNFMHRTFM